MISKNFYEVKKKPLERCHNGEGVISYSRVFSKEEFLTKWAFIDYLMLPPKTSVGLHEHGKDEEMYIILEGEGTMTVDGEVKKVKKGDMILTHSGSKHSCKNSSSRDLAILVINVLFDINQSSLKLE